MVVCLSYKLFGALLISVDLTLSQVLDIFKLLTLTYPRYSDAPSREAVEEVGMILVRRDESRGTDKGPANEQKMGVTEQIVGWISNEVSRFAKKTSRYVGTHLVDFHTNLLSQQLLRAFRSLRFTRMVLRNLHSLPRN
jgi:hypothetical protein